MSYENINPNPDPRIEHLDFTPEDEDLRETLESMAAGGSPDASEIRQENRQFPADSPHEGPNDDASHAKPERVKALETEIDGQLKDVYAEAEEIKDWSSERITSFLRSAYGKGYVDGVNDPHGELGLRHGYRVHRHGNYPH